MKRTNNKFRSNNNNNNNNYNNQIYSLNYKFDSSSIAGKCCGTALDLIKKYNELAKEALSNSDYVSAEVFRQYAEHYRKIVTDINEKKNQRNANMRRDERNETNSENSENSENVSNDNLDNQNCEDNQNYNDNSEYQENNIETSSEAETNDVCVSEPVVKAEPIARAPKKEFKVVEITSAESKSELIDSNQVKEKRVRRKNIDTVAAV